MSTTIERPSVRRRATGFVGAALFVAAIWFAGLAVATAVAEPTPNVAVFGPAQTTMRALGAGDALLVDGGKGYVIVRGQRAGFVRDLYAAGAWLVLPVTTGGCRRRMAS